MKNQPKKAIDKTSIEYKAMRFYFVVWLVTLVVFGSAMAVMLRMDMSNIEKCNKFYLEMPEKDLISLHRNYTYLTTGQGQGMTYMPPGFTVDPKNLSELATTQK